MRVLAFALTLVAATGVARADDDDGTDDVDGEFVPLPKRSIGLSVGGHSSRIAGQSENGFGTTLELALGRDRWQYFIEAGLATSHVTSADKSIPIDGRMLSGGLGLRWLARQFRPDSSGGVELFLLSRAGLQRFYLDDGTRLGRPELAFGFGLQGRIYKRPRIAFRLDARILLTPNSNEAELAACKDRCMNELGSSTGFSMGAGFAW